MPKTRGTIRVRTNEVTAPVTVLDRQGEMVMDLSQKDFHVFDNGAEQPIDRPQARPSQRMPVTPSRQLACPSPPLWFGRSPHPHSMRMGLPSGTERS